MTTFQRLVFVFLLLLSSLAPVHAGWSAGVLGCYDSFEAAKNRVCAANNPDTTTQPGSAFYRDSCTTTTVPDFLVQGHVEFATGSVGYFSYLASLGSCSTTISESPLEPKSCPAADGLKTPHPIIPATGEKLYTEIDYTSGGDHALELTRYFRSSWGLGIPRTLAVDPGLGRAWSHNFSTSLSLEEVPAKVARVLFGDGRVLTFIRDSGSSPWTATSGPDVLVSLQDGTGNYRLASADDDSKWLFDAAGKLLTVTRRNGWAVSYSYSTASTPPGVAPVPGLLISVTNQFGRSLGFAYNGSKQLTSITTPDGRLIQYQYGTTLSGPRLTSVVYPGGSAGVNKAYHYENAGFRHLVTGITDELGARLATVHYDSQGRALSSGHAGGADLYSVSYATAGAATVTDPLGTARTYTYGTAKGELAVTGADKPSGTGNSSAASRVQDTNGFVTQETDFLGVNTMYTWDINRRVPLSTTKAAGLPEAQATATQWHPTFRLPVLVTEAGRTTSYTYDAQGNPLSQTMSDTATNAARTTSWTYNPQGQPATETSPNGVVARSYAYYSNTFFTDTQAPGSVDPNMNAVSLLLHGDGANGSTLFIDSSSAPKTLAVAGNAGISTAQSRFGGASMYFNGNGSYLSTPTDASLDVGLGDFTVETWYYVGSATTDQALFSINKPDVSVGADIAMGINHFGALLSGKVRAFIYSGANQYSVDSSGPLTANTWYHLAFVRKNGVLALYLNGVLQSSLNGNVAPNTLTTGWSLFVGRLADNAPRYVNGYLDDVRFTKGVARYAANFTPPAEAFPSVGTAVIDPNATGHNTGDLQSITNAAGHVTQFTLYDRAGRVRQMVDPKGVVTDTSYTPRGWLSSVKVTPPGGAARTTSYSYDNAGQLTGVALPDATTLGYSYDAAHRLTGVTDAKGNSVSYTLDDAGNKVGEQVKDSSNNLQRNITRVYDALNRVQQVTGASH
jgi:YD repeat-containing protein